MEVSITISVPSSADALKDIFLLLQSLLTDWDEVSLLKHCLLVHKTVFGSWSNK